MKPLTDRAQEIRSHIERAWKLAEDGAIDNSLGDKIYQKDRYEAYKATRKALEEALESVHSIRRS